MTVYHCIHKQDFFKLIASRLRQRFSRMLAIAVNGMACTLHFAFVDLYEVVNTSFPPPSPRTPHTHRLWLRRLQMVHGLLAGACYISTDGVAQ